MHAYTDMTVNPRPRVSFAHRHAERREPSSARAKIVRESAVMRAGPPPGGPP